ncbi:MAG: hypothetical protein PHI12_11090 [Dehalococcoidales bacterium]|nr:hypothetical protein [Dehalococcoidales bacterium]
MVTFYAEYKPGEYRRMNCLDEDLKDEILVKSLQGADVLYFVACVADYGHRCSYTEIAPYTILAGTIDLKAFREEG